MPFYEKLTSPNQFVTLYGTTPPRADAPPSRLASAAERLSERLTGLAIDGLVVYDVQDEAGRTTEPRPFPFLPTQDPRAYSKRLVPTVGLPVVAYKCVAHMDEPAFRGWLGETATDYQIGCVSLVGRATSRGNAADRGIGLLRAMQIASEAGSPFLVGGVAIPERHTPTRSESERLLQKSKAGCSYFISQAVYSPDSVIALCRDYARDCEQAGIAPRRLILTFTPCGQAKTLQFMKWLGITIPPGTEATILGSDDPLTASIRVCAENMRRILDFGVGDLVPLGINVESVSINKTEIEGSIELCRTLQQIMVK